MNTPKNAVEYWRVITSFPAQAKATPVMEAIPLRSKNGEIQYLDANTMRWTNAFPS